MVLIRPAMKGCDRGVQGIDLIHQSQGFEGSLASAENEAADRDLVI